MAARRTGWIVAAVVAVLIIGGLWAAAFVLVASGQRGSFYGDFDETVIEEGGRDKVALIEVTGEIVSATRPAQGFASHGEIVAKLDQALEDASVVAVVLDLETPGGAVVASDNILWKVEEVGREIPVIALMGDVAASGGYYIASGAKEIIANPASITGSIGVIMIIPNLEGTADKLGIKTVVIKSGPLKDIGSPFREMTAAEQAILETLIDEAYQQFVGVVARGRKMAPERVREVADGRIYTGKQAKDLGLVDRLGGQELALSRARALAASSDATLVRYESDFGLTDLFRGITSGSLRQRVEREVGAELRPGLKYLWLP